MDQQQLFNAGHIKISAGRRNGTFSAAGPCREPGCKSRARAVQGSRYCEQHSRRNGHNPHSGTEQATCLRCGAPFRRSHRSIAQSATRRAWHEFCPDCHRESPLFLKRVLAHHVPTDLVQLWLMRGDELECDLCGRRLHRKSNRGYPVIDHNHACCDKEISCGSCIRGILCNQCNTQIGAYEVLGSRIGFAAVTKYLQ
jgi:hypothetical protein